MPRFLDSCRNNTVRSFPLRAFAHSKLVLRRRLRSLSPSALVAPARAFAHSKLVLRRRFDTHSRRPVFCRHRHAFKLSACLICGYKAPRPDPEKPSSIAAPAQIFGYISREVPRGKCSLNNARAAGFQKKDLGKLIRATARLASGQAFT